MMDLQSILHALRNPDIYEPWHLRKACLAAAELLAAAPVAQQETADDMDVFRYTAKQVEQSISKGLAILRGAPVAAPAEQGRVTQGMVDQLTGTLDILQDIEKRREEREARRSAPAEQGERVAVCPTLDRECGEYYGGWCATCPKARTKAPAGEVVTFPTGLTRVQKAALILNDAPVAAPAHDREADRARYPDPDFNRWLDESVCDGHIVWEMIGNIASAWDGWNCRPDYSAPVAAPAEPPATKCSHCEYCQQPSDCPYQQEPAEQGERKPESIGIIDKDGAVVLWANQVPRGAFLYAAPVPVADRNAVLTEAATACELLAKSYDNEHNRNLGAAEDMASIAQDCAEEIRSLRSDYA
jgi:hypothetical protein